MNLIGSLISFLITVISTEVPGSPLMSFTASEIGRSFKDVPPTSIIKSPDFIPTLCAGVSSIGDITLTKLSSVVISIPRPPNFPVVPIFSSLKSSCDRKEECGSRPDTIPCMAISNNFSSSTTSTYCSFIRL